MLDLLHYVDCKLFNIDFTENSYDTRDGEPLAKELFEFNDNKEFGLNNIEYLEILAPVNASTYKQAVYNGANAVYFGYGVFNARAGAENFGDDMKAMVEFCHFHNVKTYLALNINFKNSEIPEVKRLIRKAEYLKIDALIVTDLALIPFINAEFHGQVHASTQLGAHNVWGQQFMRMFRFDRMILSREMNFGDVRAVTDTESVDTEVFVHGALCSCFSGACLLSSMLTGNSANRGKCNQLCRRAYQAVVDGKPVSFCKGYLLSAKDICLDGYVDRLADIGVTSLKIEGRLKRGEYVGGVTAYYSDIKAHRDPIFTKDDIKALFNRGDYTDGYFSNNRIVYASQPNHIGVYAGKVVYLVNDNEAYVKAVSPLQENNGYKVLRNMVEMGGAIATGRVVKGFSVIKTFFKLKVGDVIRLTSDDTLATYILENKTRKNVPIRIRIVPGEMPTFMVNVMGQCMDWHYDSYVMSALKYPLTEEEIYDLFEGNRVRDIRFIIVDLEMENAFMSKSELNAMRRGLLDAVWKFMLGYYDRKPRHFEIKDPPTFQEDIAGKISGDFCEIDCAQKLKAVGRIPNVVYTPTTYTPEDCKAFYKKAKRNRKTVLIKLPVYVPTAHEAFFEEIVKEFDGVFTNNIGGIYVAHKYEKLFVCGPNMNIMNSRSWLTKNSAAYMVSTELKYSELRCFRDALVYTYGYLPLMHLNFCPRRMAGMDCTDCNRELKFRDEHGEYLITTYKFNGYCEHVLRNDRLTDIGNVYNVRHYFDFTLSDVPEIEKTLDLYYGDAKYKPKDTNKLHLTRGI